MSRIKLVCWPYVEQHDLTSTDGVGKGIGGKRCTLSLANMLGEHGIDFCKVVFTDFTQCQEESGNVIASKSIEDMGTGTPTDDDPGTPQGLQVLGNVGNGQGKFGSEVLDTPLGLCEQIEQFDPERVGECLADACKFAIERNLESTVSNHRNSSFQR
jgi:hypothetical protein